MSYKPLVVAVAVVLAVGAGAASAQVREGTSEGYLLFEYMGSASQPWTKHPDVMLKFDSANLWGFGGGYNPSNNFGLDFDLLFGNSYLEGTGQGATLTQGSSWFNGRVSGFWYPVEGRFTPLLTAGVGWANLTTKVPGAPPIYSCGGYYYWWCGYTYPSISNTSLWYNAGVGLRYDPPNSNFFLKLVYNWEWVDTNATKGAPQMQSAYVTLGAKF